MEYTVKPLIKRHLKPLTKIVGPQHCKNTSLPIPINVNFYKPACYFKNAQKLYEAPSAHRIQPKNQPKSQTNQSQTNQQAETCAEELRRLAQSEKPNTKVGKQLWW